MKYKENTHMSNLVPIVIEKEANGNERSYDIYSRLLKDYIVFVTGEINEGMANTFIAQLLFLESNDPDRDISVYINSGGGSAYAGLAMYDTMKHIKNDVSTINVGLAASAAAMLLAGGTKGKRYALPNAYTMIHQVSSGVEGQATDINILAKHVIRLRDVYAQTIAESTGKTVKKVLDDIERDNWMNTKETVEYGIIDKIMEPRKKSK
jgi:ATP-dependent Clp protease, protease subunit